MCFQTVMYEPRPGQDMDAYSNWLLSQVQHIEHDGSGPCHRVKKAADELERRWADAGFVDFPVATKSSERSPGFV